MLFWICGMAIEFLCAIAVLNVAPVLAADGVVAVIPAHEDGFSAIRLRILEKRREGLAFDLGRGREIAEVEKGGVEVEEADGLVADLTRCRHRWRFDKERHAGGLFPEGLLAPLFLFPEVLAVVGPENDDGIIGVSAFFEGGHDFADLCIHEGNAGEVAVNHFLPESVAKVDHCVMIAPFQSTIGNRFSHERDVSHFVVRDVGSSNVVEVVEVEEFAGGR